MSTEDLEREWTQDELRSHLLANGWKPEDFVEGEIIPQFVKLCSLQTWTDDQLALVKKLIAALPEWDDHAESW